MFIEITANGAASSLSSKTSLLKKIDILKSLPPSLLENIAPKFKYKEIRAKQKILHNEEFSSEVYFIVSGSVRATLFTPTGSEVSYQDLNAGEMFGEMAAIDEKRRTTDVIALEKTELLWLSRTDFVHIVDSHPQFTWGLLSRMSDLNRFLCSRVFEYSALNVRGRIRAELVRIYEKCGRYENDIAFVENPPKHQELASRLATHREAVTRELNNLQKNNLLKKEKNKLIFLDLDLLKRLTWE